MSETVPEFRCKDDESMKITGGCFCGNIRYESSPQVKFRVNCHCSNCRKAIGAQAVAYVVVSKSGFSITRGTPIVYKTDTKAIRTFCGNCGSSLTYESEKRNDDVDIVLGSLDHPDDFPPEMDYYTDEKVSWVVCQTENLH